VAVSSFTKASDLAAEIGSGDPNSITAVRRPRIDAVCRCRTSSYNLSTVSANRSMEGF